jgi:hypothetical protein
MGEQGEKGVMKAAGDSRPMGSKTLLMQNLGYFSLPLQFA